MDGSDEAAAASRPPSPPAKRRRGERVVSLQCPYCPRVVTGVPSRSIRTNYNRHLLTHTKERPYQCEFCLAQFTTSTNRRRHVLRLHPELLATWSTTAAAAASSQPETPVSVGGANSKSEADAAAGAEAEATSEAVGFACRFCAAAFTCKGSRTLHERRCPARPYPPRVLATSSSPTPSPSTLAAPTGEQAGDPADTVFLCPNCEQELSSRQQVKRHLRCYCPFRDDAFASYSDDGEDDDGDGDGRAGGQPGRPSRTKRSRRILQKRGAGSAEHSSGQPRHDGAHAYAVAVLSATPGRSQTATTVICPYDDCMSTFASRTRWLAHVARRHPHELVPEI
ncbi:uncharacterized protein Tco025E_07094 [Trypanosoma conorhini]|uniref:C2H2-type domain-containing protein n=1 Tax=Trypanosoma conorhini TaxID=83891 RepID=A0A422NTD3_9TRYP|nr:uncharacterized protein Tco025E_07094 [Trypanosoma conorhini]RNF08762.1 hypothetical protein Tco025E_07094 [Trypanosoma conorhini]